jgi:DNA-binding NarL/FixJ family response regulator
MRTILLFSPYLLVRQGWRAVLDSQANWLPTGDSGLVSEAIALIQAMPPDIVLADIEFATRGGFDTLAAIGEASPSASLICISSQFPTAVLARLRHLGVRGCILKTATLAGFFEVLSTVANGGSSYPAAPDILPRSEEGGGVAAFSSLTKRELQVAGCIARGTPTKEIAAELGLSPKTVALYRYTILRKLKLKNTVCLVNLLTSPATSPQVLVH